MKFKTLIAASAVAALATTAFGASSLTDLQSQVAQLQAKVNAMGGAKAAASGASLVSFDANLANTLLAPQVGTEREMTVLQYRQKDASDTGLTLSGIVRGAALYSRLSKDAQNGVSIHTHVTNGRTGGFKTASQFNMPQVALTSVAAINSWTSGVLSLGATNVGRGGSSSSLGIDEAYLVMGNLNKSSVYGFIGKKNVDFGNFSTVNFYSAPLNRLAFMVDPSNSAGVGFNTEGFNAVFTLLDGGANNSTASSATAYTQNTNNLNNFALNLSYGMDSNGADWGVGAGYLNGSRYNYRKSATSTSSVGQRNGAWDLNGHFTVKGLKVLAEYDRTSGKASSAVVGGSDASTIQAYNLGALYGFPLMGHKSAVNASFSRLKSDTAQASQFVLGWNNEMFNNVWVGLEWAYNKGLVSGTTIGNGSFDQDGISAIPSTQGSKDNTLLLNVTATF